MPTLLKVHTTPLPTVRLPPLQPLQEAIRVLLPCYHHDFIHKQTRLRRPVRLRQPVILPNSRNEQRRQLRNGKISALRGSTRTISSTSFSVGLLCTCT
ncbi:MAG: hypothetical protein U1U88_001178 [Lawsonella clevelandensis]